MSVDRYRLVCKQPHYFGVVGVNEDVGLHGVGLDSLNDPDEVWDPFGVVVVGDVGE
jgi:hypothetical protein